MSLWHGESGSESLDIADRTLVSSRDPVLDALIAHEECQEDAPHEAFFHWHSVDWDLIEPCFRAWRHRRNRERMKDSRLRGVLPKVVLPDINCLSCGALVDPKDRQSRYCSRACVAAGLVILKTCSYCQREFRNETGQGPKGRGSKFCSIKCMADSKARKYKFNGSCMSLPEWSQTTGIGLAALRRRMRLHEEQQPGWERIETVFAPEHKPTRQNEKTVEYEGRQQTLAAWSEELGVAYLTLYKRLRKGWPAARVLGKGQQAA